MTCPNPECRFPHRPSTPDEYHRVGRVAAASHAIVEAIEALCPEVSEDVLVKVMAPGITTIYSLGYCDAEEDIPHHLARPN